MDFVTSVKQAIQIYKLDTKTIAEVASSKEATKMALIFIVGHGFLNGLSTGEIFGFFISMIAIPFGLVIGVGFYHFLAKLFGGKGKFMHYFRVIGYLSIAFWLTVIPLLGSIIYIPLVLWNIVVGVVILKVVYSLSTTRAVIVELIPMVFWGGLMIVIGGIMMWQLGYFNSI